MHEFLTTLEQVSPVAVYGALFFVAYIENLFPPLPSDVVVVFGGTLIGLGRIGFPGGILFTTAGSTLGFISMYYVGRWFGRAILDAGKLKFIPRPAVDRVEVWFQKWGAWIIVVNRFISGTRAVISFFAGMSGISLSLTVPLCAVSALAWNSLLLYAGYVLGSNWHVIGRYLALYSRVITVGVCIVLAGMIVYYLLRRKKSET